MKRFSEVAQVFGGLRRCPKVSEAFGRLKKILSQVSDDSRRLPELMDDFHIQVFWTPFVRVSEVS